MQKKKPKKLILIYLNILKKNKFKLTNDQNEAIKDINKDIKSNERMFRLFQGDVGSGKTIVSLIALKMSLIINIR